MAPWLPVILLWAFVDKSTKVQTFEVKHQVHTVKHSCLAFYFLVFFPFVFSLHKLKQLPFLDPLSDSVRQITCAALSETSFWYEEINLHIKSIKIMLKNILTGFPHSNKAGAIFLNFGLVLCVTHPLKQLTSPKSQFEITFYCWFINLGLLKCVVPETRTMPCPYLFP